MLKLDSQTLKFDSQIAVLLTLIGVVVVLTGLAFLLVAAWTPGAVMVALGLAAGSVGYRSIDA
jgi:hypothetical protein